MAESTFTNQFAMEHKPSKLILPVIVISQFAGTSLWFAGNAVAGEIEYTFKQLGLTGMLTSSVQAGFIIGTLLFAFLAISDKFSPRKLFLVCSLIGASFNLSTTFMPSVNLVLATRFFTGLFLAGIYPVGMKIASGWYKHGLGKALGYLVGALVLGTAFPHLIKGLGTSLPWEDVLLYVSIIASIGGILIYAFVPDGPYITKGAKFNPDAFKVMFSKKQFTATSLGYFGHMWELYAFWAFLPFYIDGYSKLNNLTSSVPITTFILMALGFAGCVIGGYISIKKGSAKVAFTYLSISGLCCLLSPLVIFMPPIIFYLYTAIWCIAVIGDSPQFSSLIAKYAPEGLVGSSLTIVNSIGFAITIISIGLLERITSITDFRWIMFPLLIGPIIGLWKMRGIVK